VKRYLRMEGNTVVQDTGGRRVKGSLSRFASFMHFPDSLYQLIIQKKYERYKLIFSENPFIYSHPRNVHLGEFAARLTPGGGGHKAIGQTKEIEPKEFPKKLRFVLDTLNSITSD